MLCLKIPEITLAGEDQTIAKKPNKKQTKPNPNKQQKNPNNKTKPTNQTCIKPNKTKTQLIGKSKNDIIDILFLIFDLYYKPIQLH